MRLRILTLNAGLLRVKFLGRTLNEPAPYVAGRFGLLSKALQTQSADLVLLQEVYEDWHRETLVHQLQSSYPYFIYFGFENFWSLNNGLMLFSKLPIHDALFIPFEHELFEEKLTSERGSLFVILRTSLGQIGIFNLHAVSGGAFRDPERWDVDELRGRQFMQLIDNARHCGIPIILGGDFNAGPHVSKQNYEMLLHSGFTDVYASLHDLQSGVTWDPANPLNRFGPHYRSPAQRIDHILLDEQLTNRTHSLSAQIVLTEPLEIEPGLESTISDHYGLAVEIEIGR